MRPVVNVMCSTHVVMAVATSFGSARRFMGVAFSWASRQLLSSPLTKSVSTNPGALADVMQTEYEAIIDAGFALQLDCPDLALSRHMLFNDLSDTDFVKIAQTHVEALNHALRNIPSEKIRLHICWGNYEGPHCCDVSMDTVFPVLMASKAQYVLFEASNPRHAHEWTVFRDRKGEIPDNKILIPGVVDTTSNFIEHPQVVKQRIENFTNIVGHERVMAGSDCGFGTFAGFGAIDPEIAYAKLATLAQGAALVK